MKIECTKNEQEFLMTILSDGCRGEFARFTSCDNYVTCEDCILREITWIIKEDN